MHEQDKAAKMLNPFQFCQGLPSLPSFTYLQILVSCCDDFRPVTEGRSSNVSFCVFPIFPSKRQTGLAHLTPFLLDSARIY